MPDALEAAFMFVLGDPDLASSAGRLSRVFGSCPACSQRRGVGRR